MAAACTFAVGTADTGATPNTSGAFTPALNDLLIAFIVASGTTQATATLTSSIGGFTFTQILRATYNGSADSIYAFVSDALVSSATSQTVTFNTASDAATGTNIMVFRVSGMSRVGSSAIRQSAKGDNGSAGATPAATFGVVALAANPLLAVCGNSSNPAGMTPQTGWTEPAGGDIGYNTPATGAAVQFRDTNPGGGVQSFGSTSATVWGMIALELDSSAALNNYSITAAVGSFSYAGADANLLRGPILPAAAGNFSYAGGDVNLARGWGVVADAGNFSYAGGDAILLFNRLIAALSGVFSYIGADAVLSKSGSSNIIKADTFVEASDTNITAHTPTGPNAGSGWSMMLSSGQVNVIGASDVAQDIGSSSGNRVMMSDSLGSSEMDVQGDFTSSASASQAIFIGVMGRLPSGGGSVGIEFVYDFFLGEWRLADGTISSSLSAAWPGGTVTMLLQIRNNDIRGFVNGVQKVQLTSNAFSSNTRAGFLLGNFTGAGNQSTIDNYTSTGIASGYFLVAGAGSFSYAGGAANLLFNRLLTAGAGSFSHAGGSANLLFNRLITAEAGVFSYLGGDAGFTKNYLIVAGNGSFSYAGGDVNLLRALLLLASPGVFSYLGGDANLARGSLLAAAGGVFSYIGADANLLRGLILVAASGSFAYIGNAANLLIGRFLAAATGVFNYAGGDVGLFKSSPGAYTLAANAGSFSYIGADANLLFKHVMPAAAGSFSYAGGDAGLFLGKILAAASGVFNYAGSAANFLQNRILIAGPGDFNYSGADVNLLIARILAAATGVFVYSGNDADLFKSIASSYVITAEGGVFSYSGADATFAVIAPFLRPSPPFWLEISTGQSFLELSSGFADLEISSGNGFLEIE